MHASLTDLAKAAGIPRTAAYPPIQALLRRGLISAIKIGKRIRYRSLEPNRLQYILEQNRVALDEIISQLTKSITEPRGDFSVQYFQGIQGIQTAGEIFLREGGAKVWKIFEHPEHTLSQVGEAAYERFNQGRIQRKIRVQIIVSATATSLWTKQHLEKNKEELREIICISPNAYPIDASIAIGKELIYLFSVVGHPFAVLIKNPTLATTFSSIHAMVWDRYQQL